jgi:hypothetical protein
MTETGRVIKTEGGILFEGEPATRLFQMLSVRAALRREQAGLRRGNGRSVKTMWAEEFGLKPRASYEDVIAKVEQRIKDLSAQIDNGDVVAQTASADGDVHSRWKEETF